MIGNDLTVWLSLAGEGPPSDFDTLYSTDSNDGSGASGWRWTQLLSQKVTDCVLEALLWSVAKLEDGTPCEAK